MTARVTQGGGYVGALGGGDARITQGGGYIGILSTADGARVTQGGGYVGVLQNLSARVTQGGGYIGCRLLAPACLTQEASCWRIERTDGVVYTFTAHDMPITFRGEIYEPCGSLRESALQLSAEFGETENMDLSGVIRDGAITVSDLFAGRFAGAVVKVYRVAWDGSGGSLLAQGVCASMQAGLTEFTFEVTTASDRLQQRPILHACMPSCRFKLGDGRCPVDLPTLAETGTVTAVAAPNYFTMARHRVFNDSSRAEADGYFQLGLLTWTSGDNDGQTIDVKSFASGQFVLEQAAQFPIAIGDTYSVTPGCDRTFETCNVKFGVAISFGGYPHLKGSDNLGETPDSKG